VEEESTDMRRSRDTVLDLRISPSSQRERSALEGWAGLAEDIGKSGLESDGGKGCQVAARAMYREGGEGGMFHGEDLEGHLQSFY
jgi:hypothetical protein